MQHIQDPSPRSRMQDRQKRHRRQKSTPLTFEGVPVQPLPPSRRGFGHRRGMSYDPRARQPTASPTTPDFMVSSTNNTGFASQPQHYLREAQQQRTQARPGPQQSDFDYTQMYSHGGNGFLISPDTTPQTQQMEYLPLEFDSTPQFDSPWSTSSQHQAFHAQQVYERNMRGTMNARIVRYTQPEPQSDLSDLSSAQSTPDFREDLLSPTGQGWISEGETASTRRPRRISDGIEERVAKFETLSVDGNQGPITPPKQTGKTYLPPSPSETPYEQQVRTAPQPHRFDHGYDESMEETIKPSRLRPAARLLSTFQAMRREAESQASVPSPPTSGNLPSTSTFNNGFSQGPSGFDHNGYMPTAGMWNGEMFEPSNFNSAMTISQSASPVALPDNGFAGGFAEQPELARRESSPYSLVGSLSRSSSRRGSSHCRTKSEASVQSAESIADLKIEETKTDTGITLEEISKFIIGPHPKDMKWQCVFEEDGVRCDKKFGRKENIKSHVQTHLNDRQYECPSCQKCFVRQHDLKRHAKIHTGIKPYPCQCGNSFARHDALTRHRQRGMCIGAFDGIVRKQLKRGRPKKERPDTAGERKEKKTRARRKNMSISSVSSQSAAESDSSTATTPAGSTFDLMDAAFDPLPSTTMSSSSAPMPALVSPVAAETIASPSAMSPHSYVSPTALMEHASEHNTPAQSVASHTNTPPGLSQSGSPPANHFFEAEPGSSSVLDDFSTASATASLLGSQSMPTLDLAAGMTSEDLLLFGPESDLVPLDRDASMFMSNSKYDEEFERTMELFSTNDEPLF